MQKIDEILLKRFGIASEDIEDFDYASYHEDGHTPRQTIRAMEDEGIFD